MTAPIPARLFDSLANLTARLGVSGDKGFADTYVYNAMQPQELDAAYRTSWLARKIIDIPPFDMTREWRNWQAEGPQIEAIENEERRLKLIQKTRKGMTWGRLYGGAALVMGVKDGNKSSEPLEFDRVKKGGFEYLHAVSMNKISVGEVESDPLSGNYGAPKFYRLSGAVVGEVEIHWSRVIRFCGVELPDAISEINNSWGDPVWTSVRDAVRNADLSSMGIVSLLHEAKVDVINIPNLMDLLSNPEYEQRLFRRLLLAQTAKSINNTLLLDKEEVWSRKEVTFSGVVEVLRIFLAVAAGAGDIPATRLLGKSPDGMNATGDNDLRNYYDMLSSRQNLEMWPALAPLDEVLIRSALGSRPAEVYFESAPLWQMTPAEKADIDNKKADMVGKYAAQNLVPPDALAKAVQNMLIEDGTLPGLEQAIEESTEELNFDPVVPPVADPNAPPDLKLVQGGKVADARFQDATPRTLYVRRDVVNADAIRAWAKGQGFESAVKDPHVTIIYSRAAVDWMKIGQDYYGSDKDGHVTIPSGGARLIEKFGDAIVLLFSSSLLSWRHEEMRRAGASFDFSEYQPHITITYQAGDVDLEAVDPYRGPIVLGPEIFEEVNDNYRAAITEDSRVGPFDEYNPGQPRVPKGAPGGGEWTAGGGSGGVSVGGQVTKTGELVNQKGVTPTEKENKTQAEINKKNRLKVLNSMKKIKEHTASAQEAIALGDYEKATKHIDYINQHEAKIAGPLAEKLPGSKTIVAAQAQIEEYKNGLNAFLETGVESSNGFSKAVLVAKLNEGAAYDPGTSKPNIIGGSLVPAGMTEADLTAQTAKVNATAEKMGMAPVAATGGVIHPEVQKLLGPSKPTTLEAAKKQNSKLEAQQWTGPKKSPEEAAHLQTAIQLAKSNMLALEIKEWAKENPALTYQAKALGVAPEVVTLLGSKPYSVPDAEVQIAKITALPQTEHTVKALELAGKNLKSLQISEQASQVSQLGSETEKGKVFGLTGEQFSALNHYSSTGYHAINGYLRNGEVNSKSTPGHIKAMDAAMEKKTFTGAVLYRGIGHGLAPHIEDKVVGDVFEDKGFISFSKSADVASNFGSHGLFRLDVTNKVIKAVDMHNAISDHMNEQEVLLPRGSKFKITAITPGSKPVYHLEPLQ